MSDTIPIRIAVIDDDPSFRGALVDLLESMELHPAAFDSPASFLAAGHLANFDCIISDIQMPGMSGFDLLKEWKRVGGGAPVILITARPERDLDRKAQDSGALALLRKPVNAAALMPLLQAAMLKGRSDDKHDRGS